MVSNEPARHGARVRLLPPVSYYSHMATVLAFDPGYDRLGAAVMEKINGKEKLLHSECVTTLRTDDMPERLKIIGEAIDALIRTHSPEIVALETLFFNKNIKTGIAVAEVRGIILYLARHHGCGVMEFSPQQIKIAVTGYGKSDKSAVMGMVKRLVPNVPEGALDDEYDAIAVGITALAHTRN
jgi:crossover junction endodeoxyribonuclease RuvC